MLKGTYPKDAYHTYRNKLNQIIKHCKTKYYLDIIQNNDKNSKVAWNIVNELLGKTKKHDSLYSNINRDKINEFFINLGTNAINNLPPSRCD